MSTTLITALKAVPWAEVIAAAPAVADGAKKLWKRVRTSQENEAQAAEGTPALDPNDPAQLRQRIGHLESRLAELEAQMEQTAAVVRELADQNTVLIARIELNRRRLKHLAVVCGLAVVGLAAALVTLMP